MLQLSVTEPMRQLLVSTSNNSNISADTRSLVESHLNSETISWSALQAICKDVRTASAGSEVWLHQLCQGSSLKLKSPAAREKSPELQKRLIKLQEQVENQRYASMVADITKRERAAEDQKDAILPTFKLQSSFGIHVIVTMGAFYAFGYYVMKLSFQASEAWAALTGALAMTFGMVVETLLFVIRSNRPTPLAERFPHLVDPHRGVKIGPHLRQTQTGGTKSKDD